MIHLTINIIAFALSAFALWLAVVENRRLVKQNKELLKKVERYIEAGNDTNATYTVSTTVDGRIGVCRNSIVGGYWHRTVIKLFSDPDQDYNRLCAEELVEKLNEK